MSARERFDLVWIEKELFPWLPASFEQLLLTGAPTIVDYDDAIHHRYDQHQSSLVRALLGRKIDVVMRSAGLVIAGNRYLADKALAAGARTIVTVPSAVDVDRYKNKQSLPRPSGCPITVGWIGSPSSLQYLSILYPALEAIAQKVPVRLLLIGAQGQGSNAFETEYRPWSEATEASDLLDADIGVMPLFDRPEERGKCGYKLIQYMAAGLPVIASPVGVNAQIVAHGTVGFLARTKSEWVHALSVLLGSESLRSSMGNAGRQLVERDFTIHVTAPRIERALRDLMSTTAKGRH